VEQDIPHAVKLFERAARQGHASAQYNLGQMARKGNGVKPDIVQAVRLFRAAADQGHVRAAYNLAFLLAHAPKPLGSPDTAIRYYQRAASAGYAPALVNLGTMYGNGLGVDPDPIEAYALWTLAANAGEARAQKNLEKLAAAMTLGERATGNARMAALAANYKKLARQETHPNKAPETPATAVSKTATTQPFARSTLPVQSASALQMQARRAPAKTPPAFEYYDGDGYFAD